MRCFLIKKKGMFLISYTDWEFSKKGRNGIKFKKKENAESFLNTFTKKYAGQNKLKPLYIIEEEVKDKDKYRYYEDDMSEVKMETGIAEALFSNCTVTAFENQYRAKAYFSKMDLTPQEFNSNIKMEDVINAVNKVKDFYNSTNIENITKQLLSYDIALMDISHKIEFEAFNACEGYKLAKRIKELRTQRRELKDMLEFIKKTGESFTNLSTNISSYNNSIENRSYSPRMLDDDLSC